MDSGRPEDSARSGTESAFVGRSSPWLRPQHPARPGRSRDGIYLRWLCAHPASPLRDHLDSAAAMGAGGETGRTLEHLYPSLGSDIQGNRNTAMVPPGPWGSMHLLRSRSEGVRCPASELRRANPRADRAVANPEALPPAQSSKTQTLSKLQK